MFWRIIKALFVAVAFIATWLGLVFIPKDFSEINDALKAWEQTMPLDRETAFIVFSGLCVLYIFWRDFEEKIFPVFAYRLGIWKDDRMNVSELIQFAEKRLGWKIRGHNTLHALDLMDAVGDAAANGKTRVYGRYNPEKDINISDKYLIEIPQEHWESHFMDIFDAVMSGRNSQGVSRPTNNAYSQAYVDLHFNRKEIKNFLIREGGKWKGRRDTEEKERRENWNSLIEGIKNQGEINDADSF